MISSSQPATHHQEQILLRGSGRLLFFSVGIVILLLALLGVDLFFRLPGQTKEAELWMERFSLSTPALWTAGSPMRHPETVHPGVDLRFSPGLEFVP
jgi:hypothetical protein